MYTKNLALLYSGVSRILGREALYELHTKLVYVLIFKPHPKLMAMPINSNEHIPDRVEQ